MRKIDVVDGRLPAAGAAFDAAVRATVVGPVAGMVGALMRWQARLVEREALRRLDARLLSDIGVSRPAAAAEAAKPFWSA